MGAPMIETTTNLRKTCTNCKQTFPATVEFFYAVKTGKYGFDSKCAECRRAYTRAHYKPRPRVRRVPDASLAGLEKRCLKCEKSFPITGKHWYMKPRGKYGVDSLCIKCRHAYDRAYRINAKKDACRIISKSTRMTANVIFGANLSALIGNLSRAGIVASDVKSADDLIYARLTPPADLFNARLLRSAIVQAAYGTPYWVYPLDAGDKFPDGSYLVKFSEYRELHP